MAPWFLPGDEKWHGLLAALHLTNKQQSTIGQFDMSNPTCSAPQAPAWSVLSDHDMFGVHTPSITIYLPCLASIFNMWPSEGPCCVSAYWFCAQQLDVCPFCTISTCTSWSHLVQQK